MRSGQALVLVMMVLSVALTVGLSIVARSTNEVKITSAQEESARALEAAEAGLEKALGGTLQGVSQGTLNTSGATYVVAPTPVPGARLSEWLIPFSLVEGQSATVDLQNFVRPSVDRTKIRFCWGTAGSSSVTKLQVDVYYQLASGEKVMGKALYDPSVVNYTSQLNQCSSSLNAKYTYRADFGDFGIPDVAGVNLVMARLKLLGNQNSAEPVMVKAPGGDFGRQGEEYTSVGSAGSSTQKIRAVDLNYDLPAVFDNAVFSGTSLSK